MTYQEYAGAYMTRALMIQREIVRSQVELLQKVGTILDATIEEAQAQSPETGGIAMKAEKIKVEPS